MEPSDRAWHAVPTSEVLREHAVGPGGLASAEVAERRARHGPNRLAPPPPVSWLKILARQFASVVVLLLAAAALLALALGDPFDAAAIGAVLALNTTLGFGVELRARRAMDALLQFEVTTAKVIRDGRHRAVPADELVPGDLIEVEAGDAVPADARILEGEDLRVIESALTGESVPVGKRPDPLPSDTPLPDRHSMIYTGTTVAAGAARAVVVATGPETELGRIGTLLATVEEVRSPLERRLDALGRRLVGLTLVVAGAVALVGALRGAPWGEMIETAVALAIAAVPEGLPAVATIALAVGLTRMARRHALVRRLGAVESLGSTTVVCSDKTGTLTAGQMTAQRIVCGHLELDVEGQGYTATGRILTADTGTPIDPASDTALRRLFEAAARTPTAHLDPVSGDVAGDPTDAALLVLAAKGGIPSGGLETVADRVFPFSGSLLLGGATHAGQTFVKGAPDRVLAACARIATADGDAPLDEATRRRLEGANDTLAARGLRVIGLAWAPTAALSLAELPPSTFLGLVGISDPPAAGVAETVARLRQAGIRTVMITGDQQATAEAVARTLGLLEGGGTVVPGRNVAGATDDGLLEIVEHGAVFSRMSPEDKLRVVGALQARGEIVAMLGDGVNDAAALRKSDVGVAMGLRGTDLARQTAAIVLQDDRFATIAAAVEEGRVIFDNIRKFAYYLFSCNLAEVLVLLVAVGAGLPIPLLPLQLLWLNLVTDTFPALALALEPAEPGVMQRPPRDPRAPVLSRRSLGSMAFFALLLTAVTLAAYLWGLRAEAPNAGSLAFTTLALAQVFHLGNARRRGPVLGLKAALANRWAVAAVPLVLGLQFAAVSWEPLRAMLATQPLSPRDWAVVIGLSLAPALIGQAIELVQAGTGTRSPTEPGSFDPTDSAPPA